MKATKKVRVPFALFVRGMPQPPALPEQAWINKPKEVGLGNNIDVLRAVNLRRGGFDPKNGFHNWLISNDQQSGRHLPVGENDQSDNLVL